jgi:D-apiose dehydrogenase
VKIFKAGIIGCGYFSQFHVEAWRRIQNVRIVAACDERIDRARSVSDRAYSSVEAMLDAEELDFVDISTRSPTHLDLISLSAAKNLAMICQKPLAPDWETACRIGDVVNEKRVRVMIHENWRWRPWYRALKEIISRGDIGVPIGYAIRCRRKDGTGPDPYPTQRYFRQLSRLIVDETLVHHIDVARFLFGDIHAIYAEARKRNNRVAGEDQAILTLRHQDEMIGTIDGHRFLDHENSTAPDEAYFEGEDGAIRLNGRAEIWRGTERIWSNSISSGYHGDSVYATQKHFIECLESGRQFESAVSEYLEKTFAVVEAAYASIDQHRRVEIGEILSRPRGLERHAAVDVAHGRQK